MFAHRTSFARAYYYTINWVWLQNARAATCYSLYKILDLPLVRYSFALATSMCRARRKSGALIYLLGSHNCARVTHFTSFHYCCMPSSPVLLHIYCTCFSTFWCCHPYILMVLYTFFLLLQSSVTGTLPSWQIPGTAFQHV